MHCFTCDSILFPPYIKCLECFFLPTAIGDGQNQGVDSDEYNEPARLTEDEEHLVENLLICPICFSSGQTIGAHLPSHSYEIVKDNFMILPGSSWTAKEELKLLDSIVNCGFGNWQDVSRIIPGRTARECEKHYSTFFLKSHIEDLQGSRITPTDYGCEGLIKACVNNLGLPPRPAVSSLLYNELSGYTAACAEFNAEYNNNAELIVREINFDDETIYHESEEDRAFFTELQLGMVDIYRYKVFEREQRKRVIRRHGLINIAANDLYFSMLMKSLQPDTALALRKCMRLMGGEEFLKYVEGLKVEVRLKNKIERLKRYRDVGITRLHHIRIYHRLKSQREETLKKRKAFDHCIKNLQDQETWQKWVHQNSIAEKIASGAALPIPSLSRRQAAPIDVSGLPGYEKLNPAEKKLCSEARLVPSSYLEYRRIIINEYKKEGFVKLQRARSLIKIDVNKTRKIYDYLINQRLIAKDPV